MKAFCQRIHTEDGKTTATFVLPGGKTQTLPVTDKPVREYVTVTEKKGLLKKPEEVEKLQDAECWYAGRYYEIKD